MTHFRRVAQLKTAAQFREYLASLNIDLPFDEILESGPNSPLARSHSTRKFTLGNRFCVLPMEGWDGTPDGRPTPDRRPGRHAHGPKDDATSGIYRYPPSAHRSVSPNSSKIWIRLLYESAT